MAINNIHLEESDTFGFKNQICAEYGSKTKNCELSVITTVGLSGATVEYVVTQRRNLRPAVFKTLKEAISYYNSF